MGCDIHCYVEKKSKDGHWNIIAGFISDYCYYNVDEYFSSPRFRNAKSPIDSRSYALFTWLADVRRVEGVTPLSLPRGLPEDVDEVTYNISDSYGYDGHSHSWLTLKEMYEGLPLFKKEMSEIDRSTESIEKSMEQLSARSDEPDLSDIRIVFWFDN